MSDRFDLDVLRRRAATHRLRARGLQHDQIAAKVGLSERQVRRYLQMPAPKLADNSMDSSWWMANAACAGMDSELFFPTIRGNGAVSVKRRAMRVCEGCVVKSRCLQRAEDNYEEHGVWGGVDFSQRRYIYCESTGVVRWVPKRGDGDEVAQVS